MTHRGPFQPWKFCDSVILLHKLEGGGREIGSEDEPKKREGGWVVVFLDLFLLSYTDLLIGNKLISPSGVCFAHDSNWWVISPCPYLNPWAFHHVFSPLSR